MKKSLLSLLAVVLLTALIVACQKESPVSGTTQNLNQSPIEYLQGDMTYEIPVEDVITERDACCSGSFLQFAISNGSLNTCFNIRNPNLKASNIRYKWELVRSSTNAVVWSATTPPHGQLCSLNGVCLNIGQILLQNGNCEHDNYVRVLIQRPYAPNEPVPVGSDGWFTCGSSVSPVIPASC
jgi:hypothetical protein